MTQVTKLTKENAHKVATIININNPEWGVQRFTYKGQPLNNDEYTHIRGVGYDSAILFEDEFKFWAVVSFKN